MSSSAKWIATRTSSSPSCGRSFCSSCCCSSCSHKPFSFASLGAKKPVAVQHAYEFLVLNVEFLVMENTLFHGLEWLESVFGLGHPATDHHLLCASCGSAPKWSTRFRYGSSLVISQAGTVCVQFSKFAFYEYSTKGVLVESKLRKLDTMLDKFDELSFVRLSLLICPRSASRAHAVGF